MTRDDVAAYYRGKTDEILRKYGPGPRVHFHTGLVESRTQSATPRSAEELRAAMVTAQEALLTHVRDRSPTPIAGRVLDVGCGLGGGALFLAAQPGVVRVDAITIEPTHVAWTERFANACGLGERVRAHLCDAHEPPPSPPYDHVVAIESSCYLDRARWAERVSEALAPEGVVHVVDCFLGKPPGLAWFDRTWHTRLGTLDEYVEAFARVGLSSLVVEDLRLRAEPFWDLSLAWIALAEPSASAERKTATHRRLRDALRSGEVRYLRLSAKRPSARVSR